MVSLISDQWYYTFLYGQTKHNRECGRKEQTRTWSGEVYVTLFVHSVFPWANASVYSSENSYKATSNADLTSRVRQPGICAPRGPSSRPLTSVDWYPLYPSLISLTAFSVNSSLLVPSAECFFRLLSDLPFSVFPVSWDISCAGPLCGFRAKADKGILWLAPKHINTINAQHNVTPHRL